jgi:hypothetical protein
MQQAERRGAVIDVEHAKPEVLEQGYCGCASHGVVVDDENGAVDTP